MNVVRPNLTNLKRHNKTKQSKAKKKRRIPSRGKNVYLKFIVFNYIILRKVEQQNSLDSCIRNGVF